MIQSAIDGTIFAAGWQKPIKSVEKSAHGYGLRPICILYKYFCVFEMSIDLFLLGVCKYRSISKYHIGCLDYIIQTHIKDKL